MARRIGASAGSVSHWLNGVCVPTYRYRTQLHALLGIDLGAWEREGSPSIRQLITTGGMVGS